MSWATSAQGQYGRKETTPFGTVSRPGLYDRNMNQEIKDLEMKIYEMKQELSKLRQTSEPESVEDHEFGTTAGSVKISELFGDKDDLLLIQNMGKGCSYCTLWADGLDGFLDHINSRTSIALVSADDAATAADFAASRNWRFKTVSDESKKFTDAMGYLMEDGSVYPGVSAFHRNTDGTIVRTGTSFFGPGDDFCSVWHFFDLLKGGAEGWAPKYSYD